MLPSSWLWKKNELTKKLNDLKKCKDKWDFYLENKISGGDKCENIKESVTKFEEENKALLESKTA